MGLAVKKMVQSGYKMTEVGVVPEDWEIVQLGSRLDKIVGGGTPRRSNKLFWGDEIPWVTVKDFATFDPCRTQEMITKIGLKSSSSNLIPSGTLITSTRMALGKAVIYHVDVSINQDLKALFHNRNIDVSYLYYWFQKNAESIAKLGSGSTVMGLSLSELRNILIPLPPTKAEQTAIANALSDADALINSLEKLIEKKRAIKQGAMQELLTGRKRLPGFEVVRGYKETEVGVVPEDWDVVQLGSIVSYVKGFAFKSRDYISEGVRIIRVSDTSFDSIKTMNAIYIDANRLSEFKQWMICENDLIVSSVGSKPPMYDSMVGKVILVKRQDSGSLLNQNALVIRSKEKSSAVQQLLLANCRTKRYFTYIEGIFRGNANQASITLEDLFKFQIPLPSTKAEQTAIAEILSNIDSEIEVLETKLSKHKSLKQAMMQELLTGKTRLI